MGMTISSSSSSTTTKQNDNNNTCPSSFNDDDDMSSSSVEVVRKRRLEHALWASFAGDALASPSHWFYGGTRQVQQYYGRDGLTDYTKPSYNLQGSILNKSNLSGGGRSSTGYGNSKNNKKNKKTKTIVGDIILHGKQDLWHPNKQIHYHATLQAGENTLEVSLARVLMRSIIDCKGKFDPNHFRQAYITFMTTPNSHNDTYASTCHRMYFANMIYHNKSPTDCPDNDSHNVDAIDGLVLPTIVGLAQAAAKKSKSSSSLLKQAKEDARACVAVTRKSQRLEQVASVWAELIYNIMHQEEEQDSSSSSLTRAINQCANKMCFSQKPNPRRGNAVTACYLDSSVPALLDTLAAYDDDSNNHDNNNKNVHSVWKALLDNANTGGENVHRGSCLGAILGATAAVTTTTTSNTNNNNDWPNSRLVQGLYHHDELKQEIHDFVQAVVTSSSETLAETFESS